MNFNLNLNTHIKKAVPKLFSPENLDNLLLFPEVKNKPRGQWTTPNFQYNNLGSGPDLQGKSGGYIDFVSANSDYVSIPEWTGTGDFTVVTYFQYDGINALFGGSSDNWLATSSNEAIVKIDGSNYSTTGDILSDNTWHQLAFVRNGSNIDAYLDGAYNQTISANSLDWPITTFGGSQTGSSFRDGLIESGALFNTTLTPTQISNLYNNPNQFISLSRSYGADRIYPLTEGVYEDGNPVLDYSENNQHGQFLTSAAGAYDASGNDSEVGLQTVSYGSSLYYWFDGVDDWVQLSGTLNNTSSFVWEFEILSPDAFTGVLASAGTNNTIRFGGSIIVLGTPSDGDLTFDLNTEQGYSVFRIEFDGSDIEVFQDEISLGSQSAPSGMDPISSFMARNGPNGLIEKAILIRAEKIGVFKCNGTDFVDQIGSLTPTINGSPTQRRILPLSDTGTTDLFANATQYPWVEGIFNMNGSLHGGLRVGSGVDVLDASQRTIFGFFQYNGVGFQWLFGNSSTDDGFGIFIDANEKLRYDNEISSSRTQVIGSTTLLNNTWYVFAITHDDSGDVNIYLGDVDDELSSDVTETAAGLIGDGSIYPDIGFRSDGSPFPYNGNLQIIDYEGDIKILSELNQLREYALTIINQID